MVDGIRIDELNPALNADGEHAFPVMRGGVTELLLISQVATLILDLIRAGAPAALDTLDELSAALGDDADFAGTLAATIADINSIVSGHTTTLGTHDTRITANENALPGKQPLDAMLTALAALTSSNGKFLAFSGADAPVLRDIFGTCSQTAGVPTGALMEYGSNANGNYIRLANGLQITWREFSFTPTESSAFTDVTSIPLPSTFAMGLPIGVASLLSNYGNGVGAATFRGVNAGGNTCDVRAVNTSSLTNTSSTSRLGIVVFGKWY